jgi:hypothetical protein
MANETSTITPTSVAITGPIPAPVPASDPYAEFGGAVLPTPPVSAQAAQQATQTTTDPYAEFGGAALPTPPASSSTSGMSPALQSAYARGQHAPVSPIENNAPFGAMGDIERNVGTGVAKGAAETVHTVGQFLNKHLGIPMPQEILRPELEGGTEAKNAGESVGKFGEAVGEFVLGDEAVKGLSIGERLGMTQKIMKLATEHPFVAKALAVGMNALRQGTVGGGQALAHGSTPGEAATTGAITGTTGGILEGAGETISHFTDAQQYVDQIKNFAKKIIGESGSVQTVADVKTNLSAAEKNMHTAFDSGIKTISAQAKDIPVAIEGSPLQTVAQDILTGDKVPADIRTAMKGVVPDSDKIEPLLDRFANPEPGEAPLSWDEMVATRQALGKTIGKLPYDSPIRPDVKRLFGAINDTMIKSADAAGKPEVSAAYKQLNDAYRETTSQLEDKSIQALRNGNPDSIADILMNKNSVHNVNNLTKLIGDENMQDVRLDVMQKVLKNSAVNGELNPRLFTRNFNKMLPEVKQALFGANLPYIEEAAARFTKQAANIKAAKGAAIVGGSLLLGRSLAEGDYKTAAIEILTAAGVGGIAHIAPKLADAAMETGLRVAGKPLVKAAGTVIKRGVTASVPEIVKGSEEQE